MAVLMPHAPVLIPEVGRGREAQAQATVDAMWRAAREVVASSPEAIIVISPHSPRRKGQFGLFDGVRLQGDMSQFGRPDTTISLENDRELVGALEWSFPREGLQTWKIICEPLDHGAFVPLYFLTRSGWDGPTVVMSLNYPGEGGWDAAGRAIREAVANVGQRVALVASGDMSHSLLPNAPCGFQPRAAEFDQTFVERVKRGRFESIHQIDAELQELASEDVVDSTLIAAHATDMSSKNHEVLSYEGPFGVGYCIARLYSRKPVGAVDGTMLPTIARNAVESKFSNERSGPHWKVNEFLDRPAGVFVTIRNRSGELRGCRGTIHPQHHNIVEETQAVALSSAFGDTRFQPVDKGELDDLRYEVSVLHRAEPVTSRAELDPHEFGVIVSTPDGRRGLMLPGVEGLETVDQQIEATCRKARIDPDEPIALQRFKVDKFSEN